MRSVQIKITLLVAIAAALAISGGSAKSATPAPSPMSRQLPAAAAKYRVYFNRFKVPVMSLFIADADGTNERPLLAHQGLEFSPSFSLDGQWIVFTADRSGQADIFRVRPGGSGPEQLTNDPAFDDQGTLSPDGTKLAFVSTRSGGTANIWLLDLATRTYSNITNHRSGNYRPSWSPDGNWIAFSSDRDAQPGVQPGRWPHFQSLGIYIVRPNGQDLRRLTRMGGVAGGPTWSADSRRVLFYETDEAGAFLAKNGQSRTDLASVDITTGTRTLYTASPETKLSPRWLSAGRISYVNRAADDTGGLSIWHPDLRVERVVRGAVRNPSWSPDGKSVVYERMSRLGSSQHFVPTFTLDTNFDLQLVEPFPSFSHDGRQVLYSQQQWRRSATTGLDSSNVLDTSIEIMNADGTSKRTLFYREGFSAFSAVFSPAGGEIALSVGRYFRTPGAAPAQIALIKPDGSDFRLMSTMR